MSFVFIENTSDFEKRIENANNSLVVVHFSAQWAPQCKQMENVLQELAKDSSLGDVQFLQLEAESLPVISEKYSISAVPTFVLIKNKRTIETINGANAPEVTKAVRRHATGPNENGIGPGNSLLTSSTSAPVDLNERLKNLISAAPCMLFMKGTPKEPKCGFSRQIVDLLNKMNADYGSFDILSDETVRQGLKEYSKWPTYPQLYIKGELIGGVDIVKELNESGEFETMLPKKQSLDDRLKGLVSKSKVMVFMKGEPKNPRCGFSKQLVAMLNSTGVSYDTFDILEDEEVRQGLKSFSNWPTYPQVYVEGNFIGGLDILKELQETGELVSTLQPKNN